MSFMSSEQTDWLDYMLVSFIVLSVIAMIAIVAVEVYKERVEIEPDPLLNLRVYCEQLGDVNRHNQSYYGGPCTALFLKDIRDALTIRPTCKLPRAKGPNYTADVMKAWSNGE